jgi:8-oxo-dGTP pyrophosphatase MutT (NUDIX family)
MLVNNDGLQVIHAPAKAPPQARPVLLLTGPDIANQQGSAIGALRRGGFRGPVLVACRRADVIAVWFAATATPETIDAELHGLTEALATPPEAEGDQRLATDRPAVVIGCSPALAHRRQIAAWADEQELPVVTSLKLTIVRAQGALASLLPRPAEAQPVPAELGTNPEFRAWLDDVQAAGVKLHGLVGCWTLGDPPVAPVWIAAPVLETPDGEIYNGEVVIGRRDISITVLYHRAPGAAILDTEVVLVRDFRPAARSGHVLEPPGGAGGPGTTPAAVARAEVTEETGLEIEPERLIPVGVRQALSSLTSHRAHVFAVELSAAEMAWVREHPGPWGVTAAHEITTTEVHTIADSLDHPAVDLMGNGALALLLRWCDTGGHRHLPSAD